MGDDYPHDVQPENDAEKRHYGPTRSSSHPPPYFAWMPAESKLNNHTSYETEQQQMCRWTKDKRNLVLSETYTNINCQGRLMNHQRMFGSALDHQTVQKPKPVAKSKIKTNKSKTDQESEWIPIVSTEWTRQDESRPVSDESSSSFDESSEEDTPAPAFTFPQYKQDIPRDRVDAMWPPGFHTSTSKSKSKKIKNEQEYYKQYWQWLQWYSAWQLFYSESTLDAKAGRSKKKSKDKKGKDGEEHKIRNKKDKNKKDKSKKDKIKKDKVKKVKVKMDRSKSRRTLLEHGSTLGASEDEDELSHSSSSSSSSSSSGLLPQDKKKSFAWKPSTPASSPPATPAHAVAHAVAPGTSLAWVIDWHNNDK